jgi:hypothetical protein
MYQAIFDFDLAEAYRRIEAPTLVLEFTTPQERQLAGQAQAMCATMKRATPASLEVTYLTALEDQAEEMVAIAVPFLMAD